MNIISQKQNWIYLSFGLSLFLATTVIIGWFADVSSMVQIDSNTVPMQFNTALCLLAICIAGFALIKENYRLAVAISILTLLIAVLTLVQYIFAINLGIDELIVKHRITTHTASPGRMAPNTAACFILSSICLLWLSIKPKRSGGITLVAGTVSLTFVLSMLSILGYVFSIETSYGWGNMTYMALQTAIGFLCFSIGLLLHIAFLRHARNSSVYYAPIILGATFLMVTLLFTNDLNNKNSRTQDPILKLKQQLVNDLIRLNWNNEMFRLSNMVSSSIQINDMFNENESLPKYLMALYLIDVNDQFSLLFERPQMNGVVLNIPNYSFYPATNNLAISALKIQNSELFLVRGKQHLLLKLPIDEDSLAATQDIAFAIVMLDFEQFLQEILSAILTSKDQIIFAENNTGTPISLPLQIINTQVGIRYGISEFSQSQSKNVYLVFCFGLFITLALVVITFFGQRSVYQTRRLLKQAQDKQIRDTQLQQSNLTLTLATEVAKLGIWRWNVKTDELKWNERMYQIYNTPEEAIQPGLLFDYWYQSVHKDDRDRAASSLQEAVRQNKTWEEEFKLDLPGGIIKYIKATAICYKDNSNQSTLVFGSNLDVTKERELQSLLVEKSKQAEKDSLAKSQFLANMSHELRTPMNGVLGIGALLKDTHLNNKQKQYIHTMMSSAEKLLSLLNDILDLSKIEAGEMQLEIICVPLEEVVAESLKSLAVSAHEKGLDYHYHKDQSVPEWVYTDPVRLGQIITNIVSNGIKFTEEGEITVNIGIESMEIPQQNYVMVSFEVSDSGIGLSAEQTKRIFAPFSQADQSITRRYGGTGLGLSIVQQLIDLFDGSIEVQSELGKGTCVRFNIPMKVGLPEDGSTQSNDDYDYYLKYANTALDQVNCLVIDGNEVNRKWLDAMLHSWQCNVTLCADALEGINAWNNSLERKQPFDALLVDRNIQGLEAFEFIRRIQKQSAELDVTSPATVFVMTTKNLQTDLDMCTELNISQHLFKPIKQSEVFNALMTALGKKHSVSPSSPVLVKVAAKQILNVLVAEDHPVNQMLVKEILENRGHKVNIVENGRLAIEALENEHYDAILMDVQMPVMDGITATKLIRQGIRQADIYIMGLTAKALKGDENTCLDAGMNAYMTKPIKPKKLLEILENHRVRDISNSDQGISADQNVQRFEIRTYQVFSLERSLRITGDDIKLLTKLLKLTNENIPPALSKIKELESQQDWSELAKAVHKSKGMLANFCTQDMLDLMEQLIEQAEHENNQAIISLVSDVILKIQQFSDELTAYMAKTV